MIRATAAAIAAAALVALAPTAAHAGPTRQQPATERVTKDEARDVTDYVMRNDMMQGLAKPQRYDVGACRGYGNPHVQQCAVEWHTPDMDCTAAVWVWEDTENYYFEYHRMRCS